MRVTLNHAYHVAERRTWWRAQLTSLVVTVAATVFIVVGLSAIVLGGRFGVWLFGWFGLRTEFLLVWGWLRWPITALMGTCAMALAYYVLPDIDAPFHLVTPGSVVGVLLWLLATWAFSLWTANVARVDLAYGSIAAVMVLLGWFYLSSFAFLFGGLVNAVLSPEAPGRSPPAPAGQRKSEQDA